METCDSFASGFFCLCLCSLKRNCLKHCVHRISYRRKNSSWELCYLTPSLLDCISSYTRKELIHMFSMTDHATHSSLVKFVIFNFLYHEFTLSQSFHLLFPQHSLFSETDNYILYNGCFPFYMWEPQKH